MEKQTEVVEAKKLWEEPKVTEYGNAKDIILTDKSFGFADGFTVEGVDVGNS